MLAKEIEREIVRIRAAPIDLADVQRLSERI